MRKILCFAAGAAAILLAAMPAAAQRAGYTGYSGRSSLHNGAGMAGRDGLVGRNRCVRQSRRCFRNRFGLGLGFIGLGYGGLIDDPQSLRDQGFFAGTADAWTENGEAVFDYDRGYPYDWYRGSAPAPEQAGPPLASPAAMSCEISWVAGEKGRRSAVRVCRGSR